MRVRWLEASDLPELEKMHERAGFDYPFPDLTSEKFEAIAVVADDRNRPLMAAAAERILQIYLFASDEPKHPAAKLRAIRLLHRALTENLTKKGYWEANAFLPPELERSFGRRLTKTFGWFKNWPSYCFRP